MEINPGNAHSVHYAQVVRKSTKHAHTSCSAITKVWVDAMMKSINLLSSWMMGVDMDPDLCECIVEYAKGRGTITMSEICWNIDARIWQMARDQDKIGWQWFMEGMVS